jgi:hypothetical protein
MLNSHVIQLTIIHQHGYPSEIHKVNSHQPSTLTERSPMLGEWEWERGMAKGKTGRVDFGFRVAVPKLGFGSSTSAAKFHIDTML